MKLEDYLRQAEVCEAEAKKQTAAVMRQQFEFLAKQWRDFAAKLELIEKSRTRVASIRNGPD
jgi:hypothetical protein